MIDFFYYIYIYIYIFLMWKDMGDIGSTQPSKDRVRVIGIVTHLGKLFLTQNQFDPNSTRLNPNLINPPRFPGLVK